MSRLALQGSARQLLVGLHRWCGLAVLALLFIAGATGTVLTFRAQIERWMDPRLHVVTPAERRARLQDVIDRVERHYPDARVSTITLPASSDDSLVVYLAERPGSPRGQLNVIQAFVNPYTGEILGERNRKQPLFSGENLMPMLVRLHYSLLLYTPGVWLMGGVAIIWLLTSVVGLALAWPTAWRSFRGWRPIVSIRRRDGSYKLIYDLHRALGVGLLPVWIILAFTSIYLNFPSVVRTVTGTFSAATAPPTRSALRLDRPMTTPEQAIAAAVEQAPGAVPFGFSRDFAKGWYSVRLVVPGDVNPAGNSQAYVDFPTGAVVAMRLASEVSAGDRFIYWQFPLHSGAAFGLAGRVAIAVAGVVLVVMCATGLYVWWRGWILRGQRARGQAAEGEGLMQKARTLGTGTLVMLVLLAWAQPAAAQVALTGVVVDQSGGMLAGATVVVRGTTGAPPHTTTTGVNGTFSVTDLAPGRYDVEVRHDLFETAVTVVQVQTGETPALRVTLNVAGLSESMVVTGRRVETRLSQTPQTIEVVDAKDIERSVAADITDVLKKNAGVDVVQYSGLLSGIGIRGFRPEVSGINKRSLLLVDGRPSGVTNLATLLLDNVDHIEVLKGPASAVYGASAMGGVVNVITRQSRGPVKGGARVAFGSFNASEFAGKAGGSIGRRADFDVTGNAFNERDDFRMGNGAVRPATTYKTYDGSLRLGADLSNTWRLEGHLNAYRGRDINTPGDVFNGVSSQGRKNLERASQDARLSGQLGRHVLAGTFYNAQEQGHTSNVTTTNPLDLPYLPYLTFENEFRWRGAQVKDVWGWARAHSMVVGLDYERVSSESQSYARTGAPQAPFSADSRKNTVGVYAENTFNLRGGRTIFSAGGRVDRIGVETVDTPLKTNFTPSTTTFTVFNPSIGVKQELMSGLRAHATAGRAFVPADATALTGYTTTVVNGRTQINQGNPDLKPERSTSVDGGLEWFSASTHADVTYFQTAVEDRVVSNIVISSPPPPDPIVLSAFNTLAAHIRGMDIEVAHRVTARVSVFSNITHYFSRTEELPTTGTRNILNTATNTVRAGVDLDVGRLSTRLSARYVQGRQDQDFTAAGSPVVDYPNFTVADVSATYRIHSQHAVLLTINNLLDTYYYEKKGYPLPGTAVTLKYRFGL